MVTFEACYVARFQKHYWQERTGKKEKEKNLHLTGPVGRVYCITNTFGHVFTGPTGQVNDYDSGYCSIDMPTSNGDL